MSYIIEPQARHLALRCTFATPVSHHDPAQKSQGNINQFLRKKQVIRRETSGVPSNERVQAIVAAFPVPDALHDVFSELSVPQFLAAAAIWQFIESYATSEGLGLFEGIERYRRLEERAAFQAIRNASMYGWWGGLSQDMQVGLPLRGEGARHAALLGMPAALAQMVLAELVDNSASAVMLARLWNDANKGGAALVDVRLPDVVFRDAQQIVVQVPAFSPNSAGSEMDPRAGDAAHAQG
ncbi:hypothetical protein HC928_01280, partial [bacterium]|nr:hypothetical protein [bacterium]